MTLHSTTVRIASIAAFGFSLAEFCAGGAEAVTVAAANPPLSALSFKDPQPRAGSDESKKPESCGLVNGDMVNVRSGPGTAYGVLTTLKKGDSVEIESTQAGWMTIKWPQDLPVWVAKEGVQLQAPGTETEHTALVRLAAAVRGSGTRKAEPLCTLDPGAKLVVLDEINGWLKVKAPESLHAFISAKYVAACQVPTPSAAPTKAEIVPMPVASAPSAPSTQSKVEENTPATFEEKGPEPAQHPNPAVACIEEPSAPQPTPAAVVVEAPKQAAPPEIAAVKPPETHSAAPIPEPPAVTTLSAARAIQSDDRYGALPLNDRTFHDVVENRGLAMVDFNAHWCGPCRRMSPVVDSIASNMKSKAAVGKLDVDESAATANRFGVHRIPCLILFRDGREIDRRYGLRSQDEVESWIAAQR